MEAEAREFRRRARRENAGRGGTSLRYSHELRVDAVGYLKQKKLSGESVQQVASELGVSNWSLSRWASESEGVVRRVEVVDTEESAELSLVTPRGYRIEGLTEEGLLRLVERLG
jgi:transposase